MIHYLFLTVYTFIILFLTYKIWVKTKQVGFVLGLGFMYYWSLLGSWFIVFDELTNQKGKELGLAYYHYLEVLFPVHADNTYLLAISYYALFIILIQITILFFVRKPIKKEDNVKAVYISHTWIIIMCIVSVFFSLSFVYNEILVAAKFNESIYYITRVFHGKYYTFHQLLNQVAITALYIGFITYVSKKDSKYLKGSEEKKILFFYFLAIVIVEGYLLILGNKREIFFGGILGILFYLKNIRGRINYKSIALFITIMVVPLIFNDGLRSYSPTFLNDLLDLEQVEELKFEEKNKGVYTAFTAKNTMFRFLFSNEMFVPHFSMYGVLSHKIPLTYGSSILSLGGSVVPRFIWPNRPPPVYLYYVDKVKAKPGTGYTIHNASAWYLNFGVVGIVLGAFILGWLWSFLYKISFKLDSIKYTFVKILFIIGFSALCAQIPTLLRSGPEGYKAVLVEGLILPSLVIYLTYLLPTLLKRKK